MSDPVMTAENAWWDREEKADEAYAEALELATWAIQRDGEAIGEFFVQTIEVRGEFCDRIPYRNNGREADEFFDRIQSATELTWLLFVAMNSAQWAGDAMARVRELFLDYSKQAIEDRALGNL